MIAYRELVTPQTPYSPAVYRMVECKEAEILARLAASLAPPASASAERFDHELLGTE
jgi:hypothetical protein